MAVVKLPPIVNPSQVPVRGMHKRQSSPEIDRCSSEWVRFHLRVDQRAQGGRYPTRDARVHFPLTLRVRALKLSDEPV